MKVRKSVILLVACMAFATLANAQMTGGVRAGIGFPSMTVSGSGSSMTTESIFGFHAGGFGLLQIPIVIGTIEAEVGLQLARLGGKMTNKMLGITTTSTFSLYYLQIPIRGNFVFDFGPIAVYAGIGPQLGIGLMGKFTSKSGNQKIEEDIKWGNKDNGGYNRLDIALSMHGGVRLGMVPLQIGTYYDLGLFDIDYADNVSTKNNVWGISVAWNF